MAKAIILSDLHAEWGGNVKVPILPDVEFLILAGDIDSFKKPLEFIKQYTPYYKVLYVLGNHEFYGHSLKEVRDFWKGVTLENFYFLDNQSVVLNDIEFIGATLWTNFDNNNFHVKYNAAREIKDYQKIIKDDQSDYISSEDIYAEFEKSVEFIQQATQQSTAGKKVLITHHAPSLMSVNEKYKQNPKHFAMNYYYASNLDNFIFYSGLDVCIHGHMHDSSDYQLGSTRIVCNPVGYVNALNPEFEIKVIEI